MRYYEDPILGKGRAADVTGGTGGGTAYIGGFAIGISGETISRLRYMPIESVTGNSITLQAGHAYKAYATSNAITLNTETVPEGQFGMEGHIEIYVAGTGYVVTGTNVVLANALEPDSVNNCTLRFHDGVCIISVEDHVAGYIVVNGATSGDGSLYYGIATSTNDYVAFDASLNGTTIPLAGATAEGEKHVVGNGYTETTLTGNIDCGTSKFTVANLSLQDVGITGGTMTLGDAYIPSGSTVAVSGGGLAVEKVTGAGSESVIDNGSNTFEYNGQNPSLAKNGSFANVTLTGSSSNALVNIRNAPASASFKDVTFSGFVSDGPNSCVLGAYYQTSVSLDGCRFVDNNTRSYPIQFGYGRATERFDIKDCEFDANTNIILYANTDSSPLQKCAYVYMSGSNTLLGKLTGNTKNPAGQKLTISSGAILDLTGNTNPTPINPGGDVIVDGGCTVITSGGAIVSIAGGTYTKINNDGTTE